MENLQIVNISKTQAIQRSGRAGRTREGKCIRLYAEQYYERQMPNQTVPEILRVSLTSTVLMLKSLGVEDVVGFEYLDTPNLSQLSRSLQQLFFLDAITSEGRLTALGRLLSRMPLEPSYAKCLLYSQVYEEQVEDELRARKKSDKTLPFLSDMLSLVSVLSTENIWLTVASHDIQRQKKKKEVVDSF